MGSGMMRENRMIKIKRQSGKLLRNMALTIFSLFIVVASSSISSAKTVEYTCNEGIPLIVDYLEQNNVSIAKISHDSSPKITLVNVRSGSGSRYSNGDWVLHVKGKTALVGTQGQTDDKCTEVTRNNNHGANHHQLSFPRQAKSWGGIVRKGPGQGYRKKASLKEGEWITILGRTNEIFQDRPWFKIKYRGRVGYQWGGIICSVGQHVEGTFQVCN